MFVPEISSPTLAEITPSGVIRCLWALGWRQEIHNRYRKPGCDPSDSRYIDIPRRGQDWVWKLRNLIEDLALIEGCRQFEVWVKMLSDKQIVGAVDYWLAIEQDRFPETEIAKSRETEIVKGLMRVHMANTELYPDGWDHVEPPPVGRQESKAEAPVV